MSNIYKKLPLSSEAVDKIKTTTPDIYNDMVSTYGEENVVNNLLVNAIVLTEDKEVTSAYGGKKIKITKDLIQKACDYNNSMFMKYVKKPVHKLKKLVSDGDASLGETPIYMSNGNTLDKTQNYTPLTINHSELKDNGLGDVRDRKGFIKGGSYKVVEIDGVSHLMCEQILIDPETKYNYINGTYCQQSPTIDTSSGEITAVSFVNIPAQNTNMSLSGNISIDNKDNEISKLEDMVKKAKVIGENEILDAKLKSKLSIVDDVVKNLLVEGVINGAVKGKVESLFVSLSAQQINDTAYILSELKNSPINNQPKTVLLKGNAYMGNDSKITTDFQKFMEENKHTYKEPKDMIDAFHKHLNSNVVSMTAGQGEIVDPMEQIESTLSSMSTSGTLTDEHKKRLAKYCGHVSSMGNGDGKPVDGGTEIAVPNNTSLSAGITKEGVVQNNTYTKTLEDAFESMKKMNSMLDSENKTLKDQMSKIKQSLGV